MSLKDTIKEQEGTGPIRQGRMFPYKDTRGKLTIGFGRNLDDVGISQDEAEILLDNDLAMARRLVYAQFPWVMQLDQPRQDVVLNMAFNIGVGGLATFKNFLDALQHHDYERAAREMEMSVWFGQIGGRGIPMVWTMRTGSVDV